MKTLSQWSTLFVGALIVSASVLAGAQEEKAPAVKLDSDSAKQSYAVGVNVAKSITGPGVPIELDAFLAGFRAAFNKQELAMEEAEIRTALVALQKNMQQAAQEKQMAAGNKALGEGEKYLAENAKKEGVKVTDSGLQYKVIKAGDGALPTANSTVKVHYTGTFINGETFDSSIGGDPAQFGVSRVIPGWTEALQLMKVGAKWELAIPSQLAYGQGNGRIPPNSVLLFEVELLEIVS